MPRLSMRSEAMPSAPGASASSFNASLRIPGALPLRSVGPEPPRISTAAISAAPAGSSSLPSSGATVSSSVT
jgi:hypothetical protein